VVHIEANPDQSCHDLSLCAKEKPAYGTLVVRKKVFFDNQPPKLSVTKYDKYIVAKERNNGEYFSLTLGDNGQQYFL
jgi:hypothetical protein